MVPQIRVAQGRLKGQELGLSTIPPLCVTSETPRSPPLPSTWSGAAGTPALWGGGGPCALQASWPSQNEDCLHPRPQWDLPGLRVLREKPHQAGARDLWCRAQVPAWLPCHRTPAPATPSGTGGQRRRTPRGEQGSREAAGRLGQSGAAGPLLGGHGVSTKRGEGPTVSPKTWTAGKKLVLTVAALREDPERGTGAEPMRTLPPLAARDPADQPAILPAWPQSVLFLPSALCFTGAFQVTPTVGDALLWPHLAFPGLSTACPPC